MLVFIAVAVAVEAMFPFGRPKMIPRGWTRREFEEKLASAPEEWDRFYVVRNGEDVYESPEEEFDPCASDEDFDPCEAAETDEPCATAGLGDSVSAKAGSGDGLGDSVSAAAGSGDGLGNSVSAAPGSGDGNLESTSLSEPPKDQHRKKRRWRPFKWMRIRGIQIQRGKGPELEEQMQGKGRTGKGQKGKQGKQGGSKGEAARSRSPLPRLR